MRNTAIGSAAYGMTRAAQVEINPGGGVPGFAAYCEVELGFEVSVQCIPVGFATRALQQYQLRVRVVAVFLGLFCRVQHLENVG